MIGQGTNEALNTVNIVITGAVTVIVTWLTVQRNRDKKEADKRHTQASKEREAVATKAETVATQTEEVLKNVTPSNGHDTLGQALEAVEKRINEMAERLARGDARFDGMEQAEQRIAEQLAIVIDKLGDKISEVLALQADMRQDTRELSRRVMEHHRVWDDPGPDGSPSLLDWAEQQRLKDQQAKRKRGRR